MSAKRAEHKISPIVVIFVCVAISFVIASVAFFLRTNFWSSDLLPHLPAFANLPDFAQFPQRPANIENMLERGNAQEALDFIASLPQHEQGSDSMLYLRGRTLYLLAWQRYEDDRWRNYAKNPNDWFVGRDVDDALHYLFRASQSERTWAQSMALIGSIYMDKGWFDRAKNVFEGVLRRQAHRESHLNYGIALSRTRRHREAVIFLKKWPDYETDADFLRNLFFLYMFNVRDYAEAARIGNLFLAAAPRGNFDVPAVRRELRDLSVRFPEYFNDSMIIIKDRPPEFKARHRRQ